MTSPVFDCAVALQRERGLAQAASALSDGQLVVVPTDTVYGLSADAFDAAAVGILLSTKGPGPTLPPPVLVAEPGTVDGLARDVSPLARALTEAFWPGGLTVVVRAQPTLTWGLGDTGGTVALRMPLHPVALELIDRTGPLATSGANLAGQPPARSAADAQRMLGDDVAVYLDGGPCLDGGPSTIVDATGDLLRLLRPGAVPVAELVSVVGEDAWEEPPTGGDPAAAGRDHRDVASPDTAGAATS